MFEIISPGKFNSFLLQQLVITVQLFVVAGLIFASYISYKNFKLENFYKLYLAWIFNLLYLMLNASYFQPDKIFYIADITIKLKNPLSLIIEFTIVILNLLSCYYFLISSRPFYKNKFFKFVPYSQSKIIPGFIIVFIIEAYSHVYSVSITKIVYIFFNILVFFFFLQYLNRLTKEFKTMVFKIGGILYFVIQFFPLVPPLVGSIYIVPKVMLFGFIFSFVSKVFVLWGMNSIYVACIVKIRNDNRYEELSDNLTKFIGRVFHELKAPISSMIKTTNNLITEREYFGFNSKTYQEILKANTFAIQTEAFTIYAKELYKQKNYTFETIFDNDKSSKHEIYNINNIVETAISLVQNNSLNYITVLFERQYSSNSHIFCSFNEILRIFVNIFQNSYDSFKSFNVSQKNIIFVNIRNFTDNSEKRMTILISDNGPGIPSEIQENVFLQGFTTKESDELGRGFGLTICKNIVEKYGGTINFVSSIDPDNHGTAFSINLPRTVKK